MTKICFWWSCRSFQDSSLLIISFLVILHLMSIGEAVPLTTSFAQHLDLDSSGNNSLLIPEPESSSPSSSAGSCRYQGLVYTAGEEVPTDEPCLLCQCKTSVVCKLRICPEIPEVPPPGCIIVQKAKKCCAKLVCTHNQIQHGETNRKFSREHRLPAVNSSLSTTSIEGKGFCVLDGSVYAEGSAMTSSSLCSYCFCIRGQMKCSSPQCVIPLNGCTPKFRSYASCCPTNYDCRDSNSTAILKTTPRSTPVPDFLKGCLINGKRIGEGEPILPLQLENQTNPCQTCFCMGGKVLCRPLECDRPIEGCRPITEPGHCCPEKYECDGDFREQNNAAIKPKGAALTLSSELASTIVSNDKLDQVNSLLPEPLPVPESQKLTTSSATTTVQASTAVPATSIERKSNVSSGRNKSDAGSREERRNKDKNDWSARSSYEDDEKEDSSSLSFEHADHDPNSSLSFDDSTDQSASNSEMDSDSEIGHTEENDEEIPATTEAQSSSNVEIQTSSLLDQNTTENSTAANSKETSAARRLSTPSFTDVTTASISSSTEPTTTTTTTATQNNNNNNTVSVPTDKSIIPTVSNSSDSSQQERAANISVSVSSSGGGSSSNSSVGELVVEELPSLDSDSDMEFTSTSMSIINQDVESTEVSPLSSSSPLPSSSTIPVTTTNITSTSSVPITSTTTSSSIPAIETTVKNVYFIPFGVEDAVVSPLNDNNPSYETIPALNLAAAAASYDSHAVKQSLIPPTLPKGYKHTKVPLPADEIIHIGVGDNSYFSSDSSRNSGAGGEKQQQQNQNQNQSQSQTTISPTTTSTNTAPIEAIPSLSLGDSHLRNSIIMDVPVSTSLYSNGFYRNGIIMEDSQRIPLELEISSIRPFPGQVFDDDENDDDDDDEKNSFKLGVHDVMAPPPPIISHNKKNTFESNPTSLLPVTLKPSNAQQPASPLPTLSNPSRTYSKFGIQDSAYYRYNNGYANNDNNNNKENQPVISNIPMLNPNQPPSPPQHHHRYYNGPDQHALPEHALHQNPPYTQDFHHAINENYDMNDDDEAGDEEELTLEETSVENESPNDNHFNYQKPTNNNFNPRPPSTPPPKYVFAQSTKTFYNSGKTTLRPQEFLSTGVKRLSGYSGNTGSSGNTGFKPAVAFPFVLPKKPNTGSEFLGLKLSGCNIYGKMYNIDDIIRELSSGCVRCLCTEVGVQCSERPC